MSPQHPHTVLVLGGIRSGKSEFAETLAADATKVRYVATAALPAGGDADPDWVARIEAHRRRRPAHWETEDIGATPDRLSAVITDAGEGDTLLIDDLGGWFTAVLAQAGDGDVPDAEAVTVDLVADLVAAIESATARIIVVSPEVGLSLVPTTPVGRWFADAVGAANRSIAAAVDAVALVVAGRPVWLPRGAADGANAVAANAAAADVVVVKQFARPAQRASAPVFAAAEDVANDGRDGDDGLDGDNEIRVGMTIPLPDSAAATAAEQRAQRLPVAGPGIGGLTPLVKFAAAAQGSGRPRPFRTVRVIAITGTHSGDIGAGGTVPGWAHPETANASALALLAAASPDVTIELLDAGVAGPIEAGDVLTEAELAAALRRGWLRAQAAADRGDDVIVLAAGGPGVDAAAAAVLAGITRAEVPALLPRVFGPEGAIDDEAWMARCIAIRDAVTKLRTRLHDGPTSLIALGGPSIATATGVLLGAARRRTPVIIDGPVGASAALAARDYAAQVRLWCLLTDIAGDPTVQFAADRLGLEPTVSVGLGLGEGANALALLPLFQSALTAASLADDPLTDEGASR
jgi:adenosyl cobinamide kinase/adenosyl cobinamide phosphate guanylyltransferase/NaMN:DMB phosphoribosyltransferase